jgi:uncharacterized membrane protein YkvA (DUF1232 family)
MGNQQRDHHEEQKEDATDKLGVLTAPLSLRGVPVWAIYILAALGLVYILNPGAGFIELIPDNLPIVGNLDEGAAFLLIWYALVEFFEGGKYRESK